MVVLSGIQLLHKLHAIFAGAIVGEDGGDMEEHKSQEAEMDNCMDDANEVPDSPDDDDADQDESEDGEDMEEHNSQDSEMDKLHG